MDISYLYVLNDGITCYCDGSDDDDDGDHSDGEMMVVMMKVVM